MTKSKICNGCGERKKLEHFIKDARNSDFRGAKCKVCANAATKQWRENNPKLVKAIAKKANDKWKSNNPDKVKEQYRNNPDAHKARKRKYYDKNPQILRAHTAVNRAVKKGLLVKLPCSVCGDKKVEAHHSDYSKPLDVIWVCRKHHQEIHANNRD